MKFLLINVSICIALVVSVTLAASNRRRRNFNTNELVRDRGNGGYLTRFLRESALSAAPFDSLDDPSNIRFYLFPNPSNPDQMEEITFDKAAVKRLSFNSQVQTKVIVHGFIQNLEAEFPQNVKNAYLKRMRETGDKYNIIVVDWGKLAGELKDGIPIYTRAVRNVEPTGTRTAELIQFLMDNGLIKDLDDVHLVGQSLGAHVVGQCGYSLKSRNGGQPVGRISGLDPAGPAFYLGIMSRKLQTSDGKFVDAYHCNPGGLGIQESLGTVQFSPNPSLIGNIQPQCMPLALSGRHDRFEGPQLCSHNYCPKFFALSIIKKIPAKQCTSIAAFKLNKCKAKTQLYGEDVPYMQRGNFYVDIEDNLDDMNIFLH